MFEERAGAFGGVVGVQTRSRNASASSSASYSGSPRPLRIASRVPRTASGALRLTVSASSRARSASRSCSTTSVTSPRSKARSALIRSCLPSSAMRMATLTGTARATRTISRPDTSPMLTCGSKNSARSEAITRSPVVTRSMPAPQHRPLTATTIGLAIARNGGVASCGASHSRMCDRYRPSWGTRPSSGTPSTSAPEQNARPAAVTTIVHTSSSPSAAAYASRSSAPIFRLIALRRSGRLNVIVAIRSVTS